MTPLRIVIRTCAPWETMTHESFAAQKEFWTPYRFVQKTKSLITIWEQATGVSYFRYRGMIRDKCENLIRSIGLPVTVGVPKVNWDSEDEFLIPVDDDDVLYPSVRSIVDAISSKTNIVIWNRVTNHLGKTRNEKHSRGFLDTCNWAIRKSFLKQFTQVERDTVLAKHWIAASVLEVKLGGKPKKKVDLLSRAVAMTVVRTEGVILKHPSIVQLNECHSVYYLHSGSISFLGHKMKDEAVKEDPIEYFRKLPLHPLVQHAQS